MFDKQTLHNLTETIQNKHFEQKRTHKFTTLYLQELYTTLHNFSTLYKTSQIFATLYKTRHNFTTLLQNSTNLRNNCKTQLLQNFKKKHTQL